MIRSTVEAFYEGKGVAKAIIEIEVDSFISNKEGITFNVIDYALGLSEEGEETRKIISMYTVYKDKAQIDNASSFLKQGKEYSGLSEYDAIWAKIKDELFWLVTNKTYENGMTDYRLHPTQWVLI